MHDNEIIHNDNLLDQLRAAWGDVETPPPFNPDRRASKRFSSRRDRLRRFFTIQIVLCLIMAVVAVPNMSLVSLPLWIGVALCAFFCLMSVIAFLERSEVDGLDFGLFTSAQLLYRIERLQRLRTIHIIVGCALGLPLLIVMLHHFASDPVLLAGGCCGTVVGAAVGLGNNLRTHRLIRSIREELAD